MQRIDGPVSRENVRGLFAAWFFFGIGTAFVNKWVFSSYHFPYPVTMTCLHMALNGALANTVTRGLNLVPVVTEEPRNILKLAGLFSINIALSNVAVSRIPVSLVSTIRASIPAATVLLQSLAGEKIPSHMYPPIAAVIGGVALAVMGDVEGSFSGILVAILSCFFAAAYTIFSKKLLTKKLDPFNMLSVMAPTALAMLLPYVLLFELDFTTALGDMPGGQVLLILTVPGMCAFLLNVSSYFVLSAATPLHMNIAGNVRTVVTVVLSVIVFRTQVTLINALGCIITLAGAARYSQLAMAARAQASKVTSREYDPEAARLVPDSADGNSSNGSDGASLMSPGSRDNQPRLRTV